MSAPAVAVRVKIADVLQLAELPLVKAVSPEIVEELPVSFGTKQSSYLIRAVAPAYGPMRTEIPMPGGRFIDDEDVRLHRRVAFIGAEVNRKLFGQSNAIGQTIRIRGLSFEVIGVMKEKAQLSNYFRSGHPVRVRALHAFSRSSGIRPGPTSSSGRPSILRKEPAAEKQVASCWANWRTSIRPTSARCATGVRPNPRKSRVGW